MTDEIREEIYKLKKDIRSLIKESEKLVKSTQRNKCFPLWKPKINWKRVYRIMMKVDAAYDLIRGGDLLERLSEYYKEEEIAVLEEFRLATAKYRVCSGRLEVRGYLEALKKNDVFNRIIALAEEEQKIRSDLTALFEKLEQVVYVDLSMTVLGEKYKRQLTIHD